MAEIPIEALLFGDEAAPLFDIDEPEEYSEPPEIEPYFAGIIKDYEALNNLPTIDGKPLYGDITVSGRYTDDTPQHGSKKLITSDALKRLIESGQIVGKTDDTLVIRDGILGVKTTDTVAGSFRVTGNAILTSETEGTVVDLSQSFADIEAANKQGQCVTLDADISQINQGQRVSLCLVSYMNNALLIFSGTVFTGEICMQLTCILTADEYAHFYINQLTFAGAAGEHGGGDNSFVVTGYGLISMSENGINLSVSNISKTYAEILSAYNSGKKISLVADTNSGDKVHFSLVSVSGTSVNFTCTAHAGDSFLIIGIVINNDSTINVFTKML